MKILVFTTLFPNSLMPQLGVFVKNRIKALAEHQEMVVVAPVPYFPSIKINERWYKFSQIPLKEEIDGVKVYHPRYFITPKILRSCYGYFIYLSTFHFMKRLKQEFDFDLIDGHFIYPDCFAAVLFGKYFKKRVVVNARGTDINVYSKVPIIRKLVKSVLNRADKVVAVSENLKTEIVKLGILEDKVKVVANGVDIMKFHWIDKIKAREALKLEKDKKVILTVGHILEAKGFHLIIKALGSLKRNDIKYYIIGSGEYRTKCNELISELNLTAAVEFVGEIPQEALAQWYSAADLFCLTSLREGRPNVVLEALACGTPVVSMNKWELAEFVNKERGILLESYAPEIIAQAIDQALEKDFDWARISAYMKQFDWDKTVQKVYDVFDEVYHRENILFFSSDDWNSGLKTSKFHLSTRLARKNKVLFINSLSLRTPKVSSRDLSKIFNKLAGFLKGVKLIRHNLYNYTPVLIPLQRFEFIRKLNKAFLKWQFKRIIKNHGFHDLVIWTFLPNTVDVIKSLPKKKVIYYCVDDMSAFQGVAGDVIKNQDTELTKLADAVFCVSKELYEQKRSLNKNTFYSPHGVDFQLFNQAVSAAPIDKPEDIKDIKSPIIGFYGLISNDWIDYKLVSFISGRRKDWQLVFIGKIDKNSKDEIPQGPNIHYLAIKPYEELYKYSHYFDVAILPFNVNQLTLHSHPLKILEYLSAGRPVVSVKIPEVEKYKDVIEITDSYEGFLARIESCLNNDNVVKKEQRIAFAAQNSWEMRFDEICKSINSLS